MHSEKRVRFAQITIDKKPTMTAGTWTKLLAVSQCVQGQSRFVAAGDHELAVFHLSGPDRFVVCRNSCPHAGGNLSAGSVDGPIVTCPWHHWMFDLDTGRCTEVSNVTVHRYECRVEDGHLYALLGEA